MAHYIYDEEEDIVYVTQGDGFGLFGVLLLLVASPFVLIARFITPYVVFVSKHPSIFTIIFLLISFLLGFIVYRKKQTEYKKLGIAATVISLSPICITQLWFILPNMFFADGAINTKAIIESTFSWLIVTFFAIAISCFVIMTSLLLRNGIKHLTIASIYLAIALIITLI